MKRMKKHLEEALDAICHQGCDHVRSCIKKIKNDELISELKSISVDEQQIILQELISIMEVYDMQKS